MTSHLKTFHKSTISVFHSLPQGKILDIAAGTGAVAEALTAMKFDVTCCDIDPTSCERHGIPCITVDINQQLPFPDASFDYIVFNETIQYLENPHFLFREISRIIRPQGTLVVTFPNILHIQSRLKFLLNGYPEFFKPFYSLPKDTKGLQQLGINPISLVEYKFLLDRYGWTMRHVTASRYKKGLFIYGILALPIYLITILATISKKEHIRSMKRLLNSFPILIGEGVLVVGKKKTDT